MKRHGVKMHSRTWMSFWNATTALKQVLPWLVTTRVCRFDYTYGSCLYETLLFYFLFVLCRDPHVKLLTGSHFQMVESLANVDVTMREDKCVYLNEKGSVYVWRFEIRTSVSHGSQITICRHVF